MKIAIVDDEALVRSVICDVVREAWPIAEIVDYASARHVFHEIETGTVDLLITNCYMMDMDGPTLVRTLREQKQSIPIVFVSGSDDARQLGEAAGIDRFVAKNLLHTDLVEAISALLPTPRRVATG
ncbi:MAG: response regulator [Chthoniobacter sp.]|uniref:response regulator n=1 Tax=Chthoniobacter sp. TaxID=2510640 RepID=UPI0032A6892C